MALKIVTLWQIYLYSQYFNYQLLIIQTSSLFVGAFKCHLLITSKIILEKKSILGSPTAHNPRHHYPYH